ncbi:MAG: RNB domain-containing ribonuclease [Neisseriaceae bacterium]|nr:RNB domain-containing ribonuclease [Neisseriaceae bacterium]
MNVLYEESGELKVGSIVAKQEASLQLDTQHGKRIKLKSSSVVLEFEGDKAVFLDEVQKMAAEIDMPLLWECVGEGEFDASLAAKEYFGGNPNKIQLGATTHALMSAPIYFHKKGRNQFKAAPADILQTALATQARKKSDENKMLVWVEQLETGQLPEVVKSDFMSILWQPDKQSLTYKAVSLAAKNLGITPLKLAVRVGGIQSVPDYLLAGFALAHFPKGLAHGSVDLNELDHGWADLPLAPAAAFSIDDAQTTEIDDAFSVQYLGEITRVGIHIAAPALGCSADGTVANIIFDRLSTVYFPGNKITMLPDAVVANFTLDEGKIVPALSLYVDMDAAFEPLAVETKIERVKMASNLRIHALEVFFNEETLAAKNALATGASVPQSCPHKADLIYLWQAATAMELKRGKVDTTRAPQIDYTFEIVDKKVIITPRKRGAPIDKLVAEWMIFANTTWGRLLGEANIPALYRVQTQGKVRMSTKPDIHAGLGVPQYIWATSPLRRATDFVNQHQLIAMVKSEIPPFGHIGQANTNMLSVMRDFDLTYSVYLAFQDTVERFWCLRWFSQENVQEIDAIVVKEGVVRLEGLPLRENVTDLPDVMVGTRVKLAVMSIDELSNQLTLRFVLAYEVETPLVDFV